jgi:hypothetical protein
MNPISVGNIRAAIPSGIEPKRLTDSYAAETGAGGGGGAGGGDGGSGGNVTVNIGNIGA